MIDFNLYTILDRGVLEDRSLEKTAHQLIAGGAQIIQYRDKTGAAEKVIYHSGILKKITDKAKIPLIINDYPQIAVSVAAAGVHLGQDDMPVKTARRLLGPKKIIGVSTHSYEQAKRAEAEGADYIGIGPLFLTPAKKSLLPVPRQEIEFIVTEINIPIIAIGGITLDNIGSVLALGIKRVAAIRAILNSADIEETVRLFLAKIKE